MVTVKGNELTLKKEEAQEMNPPKFTKTDVREFGAKITIGIDPIVRTWPT